MLFFVLSLQLSWKWDLSHIDNNHQAPNSPTTVPTRPPGLRPNPSKNDVLCEVETIWTLLICDKGVTFTWHLLLLYFYYFIFETRARCEQMGTGSRTHFSWPWNVVTLAAHLNPGPLTRLGPNLPAIVPTSLPSLYQKSKSEQLWSNCFSFNRIIKKSIT